MKGKLSTLKLLDIMSIEEGKLSSIDQALN